MMYFEAGSLRDDLSRSQWIRTRDASCSHINHRTEQERETKRWTENKLRSRIFVTDSM